VSPRAKKRLVVTLVLAALVGGLAWSVTHKGPPDTTAQVERFFTEQDAGRSAGMFAGTQLHETWDPPSLRQATDMRLRLLGAFVRIAALSPPEPYTVQGIDHLRQTAQVVFAKGQADATFVFRRVGGVWMVQGFEMPLMDLSGRPKAGEHAKNAALTLARASGELRLDALFEGAARPLRVGVSPDAWKDRMQVALGDAAALKDVATDAWTFEDGKGRLTARLTFEVGGERRLDLDVVFDKSEGRWVATRIEPLK
jgi:hypothetical protein